MAGCPCFLPAGLRAGRKPISSPCISARILPPRDIVEAAEQNKQPKNGAGAAPTATGGAAWGHLEGGGHLVGGCRTPTPGPPLAGRGLMVEGEAAPSHGVSPHLSSHAPTSPLPCHLHGDTLQPDLVPPWQMLEGQSTCNVTRCLCTSCSMSPPPTSHPITLCALQEQGPLVPASPLLCPL